MATRGTPHPQERSARRFRRAHYRWDQERSGHYGPGGFGYPEGFHGAYAERPEYSMTRDVLYPPEPEGSGWPSELHTVPPRVEERHLRAFRDRDLARAVDAELYSVLGPEADRIAVYANDAVITLEGRVSHPAVAREALELAWRMPGVRRVRNALSWRGAMRR